MRAPCSEQLRSTRLRNLSTGALGDHGHSQLPTCAEALGEASLHHPYSLPMLLEVDQLWYRNTIPWHEKYRKQHLQVRIELQPHVYSVYILAHCQEIRAGDRVLALEGILCQFESEASDMLGEHSSLAMPVSNSNESRGHFWS